MNLKKEVFNITPALLTQLPRGAFLSASAEGKSNTMTIGWGTVGFIWGKPILMVAVRFSRYTYTILEKTDTFTVSVPVSNEFQQLLGQAGTLSGRDMDKFKDLQIRSQPGRTVDGPVIDNCGFILECRVVYKQAMDPEELDDSIREAYYSNNDYHMLYFGEITSCYNNHN